MALAECLYQLDLERKMVRVIRRDAVQFIEQLRRDARLCVEWKATGSN